MQFKNYKTIFSKIGKYGVIKSCQIVIQPLYFFWHKHAPWFLKFTFYYHLVKLFFTPRFRKKRVLGIWDYKALPWSVGDPLLFVEALSTLKLRYSAEEIDICVVYDRDNPVGNRAKFNNHSIITPDNVQEHLFKLLPLFTTCPYLGSIYQFNSRKEFYQFLSGNIERYDIYPPLSKHLGEVCNYYDGGALEVNMIQEFHKDYKYIPHLKIDGEVRSWAQKFYQNYLAKNIVPVTLSLRQAGHARERNINPAVWSGFIDECKEYFPEVVFVIVGSKKEIFEGLRNRTNVIIAKDFETTIIDDLALIRNSLMYMGTSTGTNIIAMMSDLPYLIFQWPLHILRSFGLKSGENFNFANDRQKIFSANLTITPEFLFKEFRELYSKLDKNKWFEIALKRACNKYGHPVGRGAGEQVSNGNMDLI